METARYIARASALTPEELFFLITEKAETPETAATMANICNREITLVEQNKKIGAGYEPGVAWTVMQELHRLHVRTKKLTHLTDHRAENGTVTLESTDREGNVTVKTIPCDTLVCAAGVRPDDSLVNALRAEGIEAEAVGNCARLGRAIDAIADAAKLALTF